MQLYRKLYNYYDSFRPFTDTEAWFVFRLAAFAEAIGWTLLIIGIICKQIPFSGNEIPVAIGGRIHGMLFIAYIVAVMATGSSLRWHPLKTIVAGLMSIPPYGSLVFERLIAIERKLASIRTLRVSTTLSVLDRI